MGGGAGAGAGATKLVAMSVDSPAAEPVSRAQKLQLAAVMTAAALLYTVHSLLRFRNFEAKGYDLGIFDNLFY